MHKIFRYIFIFLLFNIAILSKEPTLAILRSVDTNEYQKFSIGMYEFICRPYGVVTLEELFQRAEANSLCQTSINEFYLKNHMQRYFAQNLLKNRQTYHIEFKENRCILYAKGRLSMSELLIQNGLAFKKPNFKDKEFEHSFTQSQEYAQRLEIGLFKEKIEKKCVSELSKF
ncbi:hypothetical protein [Sulfurimonas sp.]|uniref:hypothetical protein n=1 Tax=Sulfurimonas sp. TaxID=2022749 RepID=UPI0035691752